MRIPPEIHPDVGDIRVNTLVHSDVIQRDKEEHDFRADNFVPHDYYYPIEGMERK